jgi:glucosamine-6-phosphate deaminase
LEYRKKIAEWGGVDLQLLGIGHNGHIGFNEPDMCFSKTTHEVKLSETTRKANSRFFDSLDDVPSSAITMGIGTIMASRRIIMLITGADKREILRKAFWGPVTPEIPASILQFHPDVTLVCDAAAYSD